MQFLVLEDRIKVRGANAYRFYPTFRFYGCYGIPSFQQNRTVRKSLIKVGAEMVLPPEARCLLTVLTTPTAPFLEELTVQGGGLPCIMRTAEKSCKPRALLEPRRESV